jgi:hypothetical protein
MPSTSGAGAVSIGTSLNVILVHFLPRPGVSSHRRNGPPKWPRQVQSLSRRVPLQICRRTQHSGPNPHERHHCAQQVDIVVNNHDPKFRLTM